MAVSRKEVFSKKQTQVADFAKALSHPARVLILLTLAKRRECICGELVIDLPLAQSTVSQHLKALKDLGLIRGTIDGPRSRYCINWKNFERFEHSLREWSQEISQLRSKNQC